MSGIFDQIINYSPPLIVSGTVNYDGTWDASTNTPTLNNPPAGSTKGDYYVVSVAGTQFSLSFAVGDWIISNGTAWEKVDLTDAVSSVFGRTGAVVGDSTDYSAVGLTNTAIGASSPSTGAFTTVTASSTIAATGAVTGSNLSGTNTGDQTTITGNAGTATILETARNINGVSFNGSADITVTAAAGTLTGATLAAGVTASSLTSVGTIGSLVATTADINGGTIDGTTIGATTPSTVAATTATFTADTSATILGVRNSAAGATKYTRFSLGNDSSATIAELYTFSSTYTPSAWEKPSGMGVVSGGSGGLSLVSQSGDVRILAGSLSTVHGLFTSTGLAVTGTLSSTGNVGIKGATISAFALNLPNDEYLIWYNSGTSGPQDAAIRGSGGNLKLFGGGVNSATVTSTGAAVTGTLSSTTGANFATSSGNVGIGTSSPAQILEIAKSVAATASPNFAVGLSLQNISDGGNRILFGNSITTTLAAIDGTVTSSGGGTDDGVLAFSTATNGAMSERMRITSAGNVGIGTATTPAKFNLATADTRIELGQVSATVAYREVLNSDRTANLNFEDYALSFNWLTNTGSGNFTRLFVSNAGNVGIATANPGSKLDVNGELRIGNTVNTVSPTSPDRTVTIVIGGTTYYVHAKTTND